MDAVRSRDDTMNFVTIKIWLVGYQIWYELNKQIMALIYQEAL
jgi:hypothetical protein